MPHDKRGQSFDISYWLASLALFSSPFLKPRELEKVPASPVETSSTSLSSSTELIRRGDDPFPLLATSTAVCLGGIEEVVQEFFPSAPSSQPSSLQRRDAPSNKRSFEVTSSSSLPSSSSFSEASRAPFSGVAAASRNPYSGFGIISPPSFPTRSDPIMGLNATSLDHHSGTYSGGGISSILSLGLYPTIILSYF
jgi:hypothetical protein